MGVRAAFAMGREEAGRARLGRGGASTLGGGAYPERGPGCGRGGAKADQG